MRHLMSINDNLGWIVLLSKRIYCHKPVTSVEEDGVDIWHQCVLHWKGGWGIEKKGVKRRSECWVAAALKLTGRFSRSKRTSLERNQWRSAGTPTKTFHALSCKSTCQHIDAESKYVSHPPTLSCSCFIPSWAAPSPRPPGGQGECGVFTGSKIYEQLKVGRRPASISASVLLPVGEDSRWGL